ncbi:PREDICTED: acrosin-like [Branchiostoma belcheri]|uniref:Acrosin-like n=1 Tax=Branchiostoma belcheri TaxID=7741 RepID=A0A6P4XPY0_BRABE|nr:PREDICTED: acrosin-like [Branchiostoma belcheri]
MGDDSCGGGGVFSDTGGGFSGGGGGFSDTGGGFSGGGGGFSDTGGGFGGGSGFSTGHGFNHGVHHGTGGPGFHSQPPHHASTTAVTSGGVNSYTRPRIRTGVEKRMVALVCIFIFAVKCVVGGIVLTAIGASTDSQSGSPLLLVIGPVLMCVGFVLFVIGSFRFASCKDMTTARQSGQPMDQVSRVVTSSGAPQPGGGQTVMLHPIYLVGPGGPSASAGAAPHPTAPPHPYPADPPAMSGGYPPAAQPPYPPGSASPPTGYPPPGLPIYIIYK